MKKTVFEKVKDHVLENTSLDDLKYYKSIGLNGYDLVQDGMYTVYYDSVLKDLEYFFGDEFDISRYLCKDGSYKYRKNEPYLWIIYKNMINYVINKLLK